MEVRLSEIISALSFALDVTEGQPAGHAARTCAIGMQVAHIAGVPDGELSALYYGLLLKDAGCSANAAAVCSLFGSDDRAHKERWKGADIRSTRGKAVATFRGTLPDAPLLTRVRRFTEIARTKDLKDQLYITRCERGAEIARKIDLPASTADAIRALDEHWDGGGVPYHLGLSAGQLGWMPRILAVADVFEALTADRPYRGPLDPDEALAIMRRDAGAAFCPECFEALEAWTGRPAVPAAPVGYCGSPGTTSPVS